MINKKKVKKLLKDPKLFVSDAMKNKKRYLINEKVDGVHQFTVVSAVYGVEKYLDDYFKSLVNQSLDFKKHIFLVLVDDGSLDNSAEIIKKWQKKYPDNITYIKKENGGQASARNFGLNYVQTEWVTFIDPDDFVNNVYFEEIDKFLVKHKNKYFSMLSSNFIFYYEDTNRYSDTHPLRYRFKHIANIVKVSSMDEYMQISVNSAFYRKSIIDKHNLLLNENIRPSLEDGEFSMRYVLYSPEESYIAFLKKPKYLYRKREEKNSTLDTGWENLKAFDDVLQLAGVNLFKESIMVKGFVPKEQQRMVLYHLIWQFKRIINNPSSVSFLNQNQIQRYKSLLKEIFSYIDNDTIDRFNLAGCWFYHKIAFWGMYKNHTPEFQIVYCEDYDKTKNLLQLRYFSYFDSDITVTIDNREVIPLYSKIRRHDFLGDKFVDEHILWVALDKEGILDVFVDNVATRLSFMGKHWYDGVDIFEIKKYFLTKNIDTSNLPFGVKIKRKVYQSDYFAKKFENAWLLMDRDIQADDNAEHLYRYIKNNFPEINIYFILRKESHDWNRLKNEGFKLIAFSSIKHEASLIHAKHLISSHADGYVTNYLPHKFFKDILNYKYTFLQHGVTQNDLSRWLNYKNINLLITVSPLEYNSIINNGSKYKLSKKEVELTGFPRHDSLLKEKYANTKTILIMPTWRQSLVGKVKGKGNEREKNMEFTSSQYFEEWKAFLHSDTLLEMVQNHRYRIVFFPHANIKYYLDDFDVPTHITVISHHHHGSMQTLFQKASLMITDYSSVAFELAILKKPIIYFQFDYEELYDGLHAFDKGYFDYQKNGFGPVCYNQNYLAKELDNFVKNNGRVDKKYYMRMDTFFAFHDTNNCKRTFEAIKELDNSKIPIIEQERLLESIDTLCIKKNYKAVESRIEYYKNHYENDSTLNLKLLEAKIHLGKLEEAKILLNTIQNPPIRIEEEYEKLNKLLTNLEQNKARLLVNDRLDFSNTLRYEYLEKLFKKSEWEVLSVAFEITPLENIPKNKLSHFYYMWGKTLFFLNKHIDSIEKIQYIKKDNYYDKHEKEILISIATSMIKIEKWEESYKLWKKIYIKYPDFNKTKVYKNIIISLKYLNKRDELELFKNKFIKYKFLETNDNDIEILNCL